MEEKSINKEMFSKFLRVIFLGALYALLLALLIVIIEVRYYEIGMKDAIVYVLFAAPILIISHKYRHTVQFQTVSSFSYILLSSIFLSIIDNFFYPLSERMALSDFILKVFYFKFFFLIGLFELFILICIYRFFLLKKND